MRNHSFIGAVKRWASACSWRVLFWTTAASLTFQLAVAQTSPPCSPSNPAPISGSTGTQGVLAPTNADPAQGLVWPAGTVFALISMDTGQIQFFGSGSTLLSSTILPGAIDGTPAFPGGMLNFTSVYLPAGVSLGFTTGQSGLTPPVILLSCQDVILDTGSNLVAVPTALQGPVPAAFLGGSGSNQSSVSPAGFGPRSGNLPSAGSLYPPIGGGGGNGGAGSLSAQGPAGGSGGPAIIFVASQRITLNGTIWASGFSAGTGSSAAQGGAGGSVRLEGLLVDGTGTIITSGGADSDGVVRSPAGPIEIQAFLSDGDLFTSPCSPPQCTTTAIRGNTPVQPIPDNLPAITIEGINYSSSGFGSVTSNTGSLTTPDKTLPTPNASTVNVLVDISTQGVPVDASLIFRAVGADGSVATVTGTASSACEFVICAVLPLNAGTTYQIVVTPSTQFSIARTNSNSVAIGDREVFAKWNRGLEGEPSAGSAPAGETAISVAEQWMKAFAVRRDLAKITAEDPTAQLARAMR